jgi:hypothetical protein
MARIEILEYLFFRNTTDCLITFIHRKVDEIIKIREHTDLTKLCHSCKQRKLDILILCLEYGVECL